MKQLTKLAFQFARNLKKSQPSSLQQLPNPKQLQDLDQQIQQQIIPFTANSNEPESLRKYQDQVKQKLVKNLSPRSVGESHLASIQGQDYNSSKLVNRPNKGVVWGLGGQLMVADRKVHLQGVKGTIDDILDFLELHQVKDIYIHDFFQEDQNTNKRRYSIIGSCFSAKHCWKTGIQLKNAFNLNSSTKFHKKFKKYDPIDASANGAKNQEWSMVEYKDFQVNLMTEEQREAADLQWKWNNPVSEERLDKYMMAKARKGRKNQFQDL